MDAKELFQNQVLDDIKAIARELSQVQSFSGLLAHQQKIQSLYEKYIFLKQLHTSKYQHLLDGSTIEETIKEVSRKEPEARDFYEVQEPVHKAEEEIQKETVGVQEPEIKEDNTEIQKEEVVEVPEPEEKKSEISEGLKPLSIEIAEIKPVEKGKKLNPVNLDFNDSIAFISQLFNGSKTAMDSEFKGLNETETIEQAKKWMEEMFHKYNWQDKAEYVERLSALVVHRFES